MIRMLLAKATSGATNLSFDLSGAKVPFIFPHCCFASPE